MDNYKRREIEKELLAAIMRNPASLRAIDELVTEESFTWLPYKNMFRAITEVNNGGFVVDAITVGDELNRRNELNEFCAHDATHIIGRTALFTIRQESGKNPVSYAEILKNYADNSAILDILSKSAVWAQEGRKTADILADLTHELTNIVPVTRTAKSTISLKEAVEKAYDITDQAGKGKISYIKTGIRGLDYMMLGLSAPDVTVVAARPGIGKTAFLTTIVYNIIKRDPQTKIAYFSLEMGSEQVAMRLISMDSGVTFRTQRKGLQTDDEFDRYNRSIETLGDSNICLYLNDIPAIAPKLISRELRRLGDVELLVLDYLQLASPDEKLQARHLEVASISQALKRIAKEFSIPVLVAAQLSRDIEKRKRESNTPVLSDLAESGSIERDADNIIFLHREMEDTLTDVILAKQRNGEVGKFSLNYIGERTMFVNLLKE